MSRQSRYRWGDAGRNRPGSILIIALWTVIILSAFAVTLGSQTRQHLMLAGRLDDRDKLRYIAEAGVDKAILGLLKKSMDTYVTRADLSAAAGVASVGDGIVDVCHVSGGRPGMTDRYSYIDEESKVNINFADRMVMERLFRIVLAYDVMQAQELSASIVDWRDADNELSVPIGSAEEYYYTGLPYPYRAKNALFDSVDELLLVKGMDSGILERLKNYITVYGDGKVNVNTASKAVLLSLGLKDDIAQKVVDFRIGKDELIDSADDGFFPQSASIASSLSQAYQLSPSDLGHITAIVEQYLSVNSKSFTIKCAARLKNKKQILNVVSVVARNGKILYWQES